MQIFEFVFF